MKHHLNALAASLWSFQQAGLFCDTAVISRNGVKIPAHAAVLAAASARLHFALHQSWSTCDASLCYTLDLKDYEDQTLVAVLKYIYTGDTSVLTQCSADANDVLKKFEISVDDLVSTKHQQSTDAQWSLSDDDAGELNENCNEDERSHRLMIDREKRKERLGIDESLTHTLAVDWGSRVNQHSLSSDNQHTSSNDAVKTSSKQQRFALLPDSTRSKMDLKADIESDPNSESKGLLNIVVTIRKATACRHTTSRTRTLCRKQGMCRRRLVRGKKLRSEQLNAHENKSSRAADTAKQDDLFGFKLEEQTVGELGFEAESMTLDNLSTTEQEYTTFNNANKVVSSSIERNFVCDVCNRDFIFAAHLRRHKARHESAETGQYACSKCELRFCRRSQLLRHEIQHTGVWPAQCRICGSGFFSEAMLAEHSGKLHRVTQPYACETCGRRFVLEENLLLHARLHTKRSDRALFKCATCGKTFRCAAYLRNHEQIHTGGPRPFVCDVCGKGFMGNSNLTTHRRIHTGERPYACTICNKRFLQLCAVREHEKIHLGLKQFVCDVCGKQFMTYAQLYNHGRIHAGVKSFECDSCEKRFYTNGDLMKHARIHADRRPFVCDVCGKAFKYSSNLHGHARIHTGARPYVCSTCGKGFVYSSHLSRHVKLHVRERAAAAGFDQ